MSERFYKTIGSNFGSFPYHLGLNTLAENKEEFDSSEKCGAGGLYFTDAEHIFDYLCGDTLCEISVPAGARVVRLGGKWKADQIIIESMCPLWTVETIQHLISGMLTEQFPIEEAAENGHLDVVKFLVEKGADISSEALQAAAENGHLDVVKFLVEQGADVCADDNYALCAEAAANGHLDVVKFLVEQGADVCADYSCALWWAPIEGHLDVVKFLVEQGADISADNNCALRVAAENGHLDVVKFLVEQGADISADNNYALRWATKNGHLDVAKFLGSLAELNVKRD